MKARLFTVCVLVTSLIFLFALALTARGAGSVQTSAGTLDETGSALTSSGPSPSAHVPEQQFTTTHPLAPIDVEIVALELTGAGLGVGESVTLTAQTSPPLLPTGVLNWTCLSGWGGIEGTDEVVTLTLFHPGPISHDTPGVVVGVEYATGGFVVSDTLSIPLNEPQFSHPFIQNFTLHFGDKPFPEPGDTVTVSLEHALPPGYDLAGEIMLTQPTPIFTDVEAFVPVQLQAWAYYTDPGGIQVGPDFLGEEFALPFSSDLDSNGIPDLVDLEFTDALNALQELPLNPETNDEWRALKALLANMIRTVKWPFPDLTYDPNCKPSTFGYYQWNGSKINDLQLCPKAFVTPLQVWVTFYHELKHWWDEKVTGVHQDHKDVERFGWQHGTMFEPNWTDKDREIYKQMDPPVGPPLTFDVAWGSHVSWTLTLSNTNPTHALEDLQFGLKSSMASGGQYVTGETLGGGISVGADGLADTAAAGDDVQLIPVGQGRPNAIVIQPGANGLRDTSPSGDDTVFSSEERLTSGADGIVGTTAQGDDVQVIPLGLGYTSTTFMPLAIGAGPNEVLDSTPLGDDAGAPPPSLPITNLQVTTPISIPAGEQETVVISFDVADSMPGAGSPSGAVQMVFELIAQRDGGPHRETIEAFLFLPPSEIYLPVVMKNY